WRQEAPRAPGHPRDPYKPYDSLVAAGSYLARLQSGAIDGRRRSLHTALSAYGGGGAYARPGLAIATARQTRGRAPAAPRVRVIAGVFGPVVAQLRDAGGIEVSHQVRGPARGTYRGGHNVPRAGLRTYCRACLAGKGPNGRGCDVSDPAKGLERGRSALTQR